MARRPDLMNRGVKAQTDLLGRPASQTDPAEAAALDDLRRRLLRFAVSILWNFQDAEEIVQEAFKLALASGPTGRDRRADSWMFRTVTNLALNLRRRRKPEPLAEWIDVPQNAPPDSRLRRAEQLETLRGAVADLPDRQRTALILRTVQQMSYADVADIMQLSIPAVRAHVHFARTRLAERLGANASEDQP